MRKIVQLGAKSKEKAAEVLGRKVILGFVQTDTENEAVCAAFLRELVDRGLRYEQGVLVVIDGSKGLR